MKRYSYLLAVGLCFMLSGCQNKESEQIAEVEEVKTIDEREDISNADAKIQTQETSNSEIETQETPLIESKDYQKVLESQSDNNMIAYNEEDYDGDGNLEAFAFIGNDKNEEGAYEGELWFINGKGAKLIEPMQMYWDINKIYDINNKKYVVLSQYVGTGDVSYVWAVVDGEAKETSISKQVSGFKIDEFITVLQDRYDLDSSGSGHTWKPYYLFVDDNGEFKEYGGIEIEKNQLLKFSGADEIISQIEGEGYQINTIIYRENGIININYSMGTMQKNATLLSDENTVSLYNTNEGVYDLALLESIAVYPEQINIPQ